MAASEALPAVVTEMETEAEVLAGVESTLRIWEAEGPPRNPRASCGALADRLQALATRSRSLEAEAAELRKKYADATRQVDDLSAELVAAKATIARAATDRQEIQDKSAAELAALKVRTTEAQAAVDAEREAFLALSSERASMSGEDFAADLREARLVERGAALLARAEAGEADAVQQGQRSAALASQLAAMLPPVSVMCRVRPLESYRSGREMRSVLQVDANEITVEGEGSARARKFRVDRVLDGYATQDDMFSAAAPWVENVITGGSACIFAYGATGGGKTHSLLGDLGKGNDEGLAHFAMRRLTSGFGGGEVRISMVEVYCDQIRDLLADSQADGGPPTLQCSRRDAQGRMLLDCVETDATCFERATEVLQQGFCSRASEATLCNEQSSRSHVVLTVEVMSGPATGGRLVLVDLAGSENVQRSGADQGGQMLAEAKAINKSLTALADVVEATAKRNHHVPFRNSRLTMLLEEAFVSAKLLVFVHVSPRACDATNTGHSLHFGGRIQAVDFGAQKVKRDQEERQKAAELRDQQESAQLRGEVERLKKEAEVSLKSQQELKQQLAQLREQLRAPGTPSSHSGGGVGHPELRSASTRSPTPHAGSQESRLSPIRRRPLNAAPAVQTKRSRDSTPDKARAAAAAAAAATAAAAAAAAAAATAALPGAGAPTAASAPPTHPARAPLGDLTNSCEEITSGNMIVKRKTGELKAPSVRPATPERAARRAQPEGGHLNPARRAALAAVSMKGSENIVGNVGFKVRLDEDGSGQAPLQFDSEAENRPDQSIASNRCSSCPALGGRSSEPEPFTPVKAMDCEMGMLANSKAIVLRSAVRAPTDFSSRMLRRRELGISEGKRVTFCEEKPQISSPPKWYLEAKAEARAALEAKAAEAKAARAAEAKVVEPKSVESKSFESKITETNPSIGTSGRWR